jgi:flagellar biosynthesis/type III secretory pathway protein FliH
MLLTWGTSVGGMVLPLDNYIRSGNFNLTDDQRYLVLAGIAFIMFFENKRGLTKILEKIKEEGLEDAFKAGLEKATDLKESFKSFLSSINVTVGSFLDTVAYSFLIPIIVDIQSIAAKSTDLKEASMLIAERLIASGVVIVTAKVLSTVIKKILERIS